MLVSVGLTVRSACWNQSFDFPEGAWQHIPSNPTMSTHHPWMENNLRAFFAQKDESWEDGIMKFGVVGELLLPSLTV